MGLMDTVSKILLEIKADTSQAKAAIKELSGVQKQAAKDELAAIESSNKGYDGYIDRIGKIGLAINTAKMAIDAGAASLKAFSEHERLTAAAGLVNLGGLQKASGGLRTEMELLSFAAKAQSGVFRASGDRWRLRKRRCACSRAPGLIRKR